MTTAEVIRNVLLYFILPVWLVMGLADWLCHRMTRIERTSGTRESLLHLAQLAEAGTAILCGLFLEINAAVLAIIAACWVLHEITAFHDLASATGTREITPIEQHIHGYLLVLPFVALVLVTILHWPQAAALVGLGPELRDLSLDWKTEPLPIGYLIGLPAAVVVMNLGPYLEELWRCVRWRGPHTIRLRFADRSHA